MIPTISQKKLIEELSPLIPEWDLELFPVGYVEHPENFVGVRAVVTNKKDPKIVQASSYYGARTQGRQYIPIYNVIGTAIFNDTTKRGINLSSKLLDYMSEYWFKHFGRNCFRDSSHTIYHKSGSMTEEISKEEWEKQQNDS